MTGQIDQALQGYEVGRAIREQLLRDRPDDPQVLTGLARSHGFIGDLFLVAGAREAEAAALVEPLDAERSSMREFPRRPSLELGPQ